MHDEIEFWRCDFFLKKKFVTYITIMSFISINGWHSDSQIKKERTSII